MYAVIKANVSQTKNLCELFFDGDFFLTRQYICICILNTLSKRNYSTHILSVTHRTITPNPEATSKDNDNIEEKLNYKKKNEIQAQAITECLHLEELSAGSFFLKEKNQRKDIKSSGHERKG